MSSGDSGELMLDYFKNMPKVELHAHLNGSLSESTVRKLIELKKEKEGVISEPYLNFSYPMTGNLSECFQLFNVIHGVTNSPEAVYKATLDVIEDFYNDSVHYLELRTTPKDMKESMTQDIYVETVLKAIEEACAFTCKGMTVKLLLSIDRKRPFSFAEKMVKIAEKHLMSSSVIGIDLSGDPMSGDIHEFIPLLEYAKKIGLKLAVHISEVPNGYNEVEQLLRLEPDRLGHGTYLHPNKGGSYENYELLNQRKIPLEICLTSNVISKTVPSYKEHHFPLFRSINYPCVLCTDDKGIFNTTLTNEFLLASKYYSLTKEQLFDISFQSINYIFSTEAEKEKLREIWKKKRTLMK